MLCSENERMEPVIEIGPVATMGPRATINPVAVNGPAIVRAPSTTRIPSKAPPAIDVSPMTWTNRLVCSRAAS